MNTTITLRTRKISNGRLSLYLDYYPFFYDPISNKRIRHEYLGLYMTENPKNETEKLENKEVYEIAEAERCKRVVNIKNEELGFTSKFKKAEDFVGLIDTLAKSHNVEKWTSMNIHFKRFCKGSCPVGMITEDLCNMFKNYLLTEARKKDGSPLSNNTASAYFNLFRCALKFAYKHHYLGTNMSDFVEPISVKPVRKEYLTMKEVIQLKNTPCRYPILKTVSLFSILTGLRISDILSLKWSDMYIAPDGGPCIRKMIEKSGREETIYISWEAYNLCGERRQGLVFKEMKRYLINGPLKDWLAEAGLDYKYLTFHCFRHTNATLLVAGGNDIYTVSKMLTHANVQTTQIYADLVDEKKRKAANTISLNTE